MAHSNDGYCLACLDSGAQLPRLTNLVKEAIAVHLSPSELGRCLLATRSSHSRELADIYLSGIRVKLEAVRVGNSLASLLSGERNGTHQQALVEGPPEGHAHNSRALLMNTTQAYKEADPVVKQLLAHLATLSRAGINSGRFHDQANLSIYIWQRIAQGLQSDDETT